MSVLNPDNLVQGVILATGVISIWLINDPRASVARWACLVGLASEPFWLWATWHSGQWGMLALAGVYTLAWARGAWHAWVQPWQRHRSKSAQQRRVEAARSRIASRWIRCPTCQASVLGDDACTGSLGETLRFCCPECATQWKQTADTLVDAA